MLIDRNDELCVLYEKAHMQEAVIAQVRCGAGHLSNCCAMHAAGNTTGPPNIMQNMRCIGTPWPMSLISGLLGAYAFCRALWSSRSGKMR